MPDNALVRFGEERDCQAVAPAQGGDNVLLGVATDGSCPECPLRQRFDCRNIRGRLASDSYQSASLSRVGRSSCTICWRFAGVTFQRNS